jgi:predicted transcriptional regulator
VAVGISDYIRDMDTTPHLEEAGPETAAKKRQRLASEAKLIAEADAEIAAGLVVDEAKVDAWIDSLGTDFLFRHPRA